MCIAIQVKPAESVVRYREGDFNEVVYVKGNGNTIPATPEDIISLSRVFFEAIKFIDRNTKTGWQKTESGGRKELRSYPKEAVREALVNAIAHRDYSIHGTQIDIDIYDDRIDIVSPGSWLLPRNYDEYPVGSIPSIRRNKI